MNPTIINARNVGRIAERIVSNELESRGFRVSDLNADGTAANADLLAVGHGLIWQIQVKGATYNAEKDHGWWIQYGHATEAVITRKEPMFNRHSGFYTADMVALIAVKSPKDYYCVILKVTEAEEAAQMNLNRVLRTPKRDGMPRKPYKVWASVVWPANPGPLLDEERKLLKTGEDNWATLFNAPKC